MHCLVLALWSLTTIGLGQTPELRFAWLSDTHVGSPTGADDLAAAVGEINSKRDIQFVLLSGDITEFGSNQQLKLAKSILDSLRKPFHIIPGNHDTKWSASGGTTFPAIWGGEHFVFDAGGYRFLGIHQGPRMKMADGHWAPEDLRWLDTVLAAMPPGHPFFVITHYPVDSSIANWYELLDRVKRYNGTKNGLLLALDSKTGRLLWKHRVGVAAIHTVTPLDAQRVLTTDFDGTVQLIVSQQTR